MVDQIFFFFLEIVINGFLVPKLIVHVNIKNMLLKVSLVPANTYVNVKPRGSVHVHSLSNTLKLMARSLLNLLC